MKKKKLPIGVSDFKKMIEKDYYYVDKTLLIKEIIDSGDTILLLPRPRRFGKTLNLSMVGYFYDCCPVAWDPGSNSQPPVPAKESRSPAANKHLFDSLFIFGAGPEYLDKMGQHPVIFLTFRLLKMNSCLAPLVCLWFGYSFFTTLSVPVARVMA